MQLRASDVDELLEKSSITEIETSLVVLFVEKNNISTNFKDKQKYYADCVKRNLIPHE